MNAPKKREPAPNGAALEIDPLLRKPIPHAYALVPHPDKPGMYYSVHLEGVTAERLEHLELNSKASAAPMGMLRIEAAMQRRHFEKKWGG